MNPYFSIVVPTYNRAALIGKTLRSLLDQSYDNYEIIVVDDGSTDNTEEVVRSFDHPRLRYFKKQNAERAAARNYGASKAEGEFVNFFDSDDLALPDHLSVAAQLLQEHPEANWFHLGYEWADPDGVVFRSVNRFQGDTLNNLMASGNPLSCNGVFVRREVLKQHPFNEDRALSASEDYELWCRLTARYPLYYSNKVTSTIIDHEARSVRVIHGEKLIQRLELLIHYLRQDAIVMQYFGNSFCRIRMDSNSYIALHLANAPKYKFQSIVYLLKSMGNNLYLLRTKRFYACVKNILIKW
ncbi:MAG: glycosyltransferase family A protein [Chitinophagaceae bacterium]